MESVKPQMDLGNIRDLFADIVGTRHVMGGDEIEPRYKSDLMGFYESKPDLLVRPGSTAEVAAVLRVCYDRTVPVSPIGGNSGLVGGTSCIGGVSMALDRMAKVEQVDWANMTMLVEAGVLLQSVQEQAGAHGAIFPVDFGARGSATIGGMIATNAGGNKVLRYGMMRDSVLGIEAVLADGTIVSGLRSTLKDNAGYDWKHLLIGSEGTLGIVTRAMLRLRPAASGMRTALLAVRDVAAATHILRTLEAKTVGGLVSFELMWADYYEQAIDARRVAGAPPLRTGYPLYAIVEIEADADDGGEDRFLAMLGSFMEEGLSADIIIASSERERAAIWEIRENIGEAMAAKRPFLGFDISVGLAQLAAFVSDVRRRLCTAVPEAEAFFYGHAGDGNLHIIVTGYRDDEAMARSIESHVYAVVADFKGSISAEHGIGLHKMPFLGQTRSREEIQLMRRLKLVMDPSNILNPGKVLGEP
jgi:FAD/FMN-containing dehydrogenase